MRKYTIVVLAVLAILFASSVGAAIHLHYRYESLAYKYNRMQSIQLATPGDMRATVEVQFTQGDTLLIDSLKKVFLDRAIESARIAGSLDEARAEAVNRGQVWFPMAIR